MISAPFQFLTPQQLAAAAQAAFRPPSPMGAPGMQMPQMGGGGGMSLGQGAAMLGMGLGGLRGLGNPAQKPPGMPVPNQYGVMDPEASQSAYPGTGTGGGGGFFDWLARQFG